MKQVNNIVRRAAVALCFVLAALPASAGVKIDSSEVYGVTVVKHSAGLYDGPLPYIVFGTIIIAIGLLGYFYWRNGMQND